MNDFEKRRAEFNKNLLEVTRRYGIPVYHSKPVSEMSQQELTAHAESVRKRNIDACVYFWDYYPKGSKEKRDLEFEKAAYEQMTPKEILIAEQRKEYVRRVELTNFLIDLKISKLEAQRPELNPLIVRAKVA